MFFAYSTFIFAQPGRRPDDRGRHFISVLYNMNSIMLKLRGKFQYLNKNGQIYSHFMVILNILSDANET